MGINNIIKNTLHTNWTWTDDFEFFFQNNAVPFPATGLLPKDTWDMCVINVDLPQVSSSIETKIIAQKLRLNVPIHDAFTVTVTFRDVAQMKLKEYFTEIWALQQSEYFDDIKSVLQIRAGNGKMFDSQDVLISSVSQSQLDNNNNQIIEFSVEFISVSYGNNTLVNFNGYKE